MNYDKIYQNAEDHYVKGDYQQALKLFQRAYSLKPCNDCQNYIGCCYLNLGDFDSSKMIFQTLIKNNPEWERPIFNLGRVYLKLGSLEEALECFKNSIAINPENEDCYYYLGVYYEKIHSYEVAKIFYKKSLYLDYSQSETHLNLGLCLFRLGNDEEALEEFDLAYEFDKKCIDAIFNKGVVYYEMKNYNKALPFFIEVNNHYDYDVENMLYICHCYYNLNLFEETIKWVNKVLVLRPENKTANKLLNHLLTIKSEE